ncbi:efflux RND transporter permease subunit [Mucisphaera sp.]|uniref:efflux RND transporter permease subunit n=1 Tax=Mucisphaera sp. TaxID=2913024 RepID=UPI003D0C8A44
MNTLLFDRPRILLVLILLVLAGGFSAYQSLPRTEDPRLTQRWATILTTWPGTDALRIEALITEKIEEEIRDIEEIKSIESSSRAGISVIQIELHDWVGPGENRQVFSRLRDRVADAEQQLPAGAGKPEVLDDENDAYTFIAAVVWEHPTAEPRVGMMLRLAEQVEDRLAAVPGTDKTDLFGDPEEEIAVTIDRQKLAGLNLTTADLRDRVVAADVKVSAGRMQTDRGDLLVEVAGEVDTLDRIRRIPIRVNEAGQMIRLGDIAEISKQISDPPRELAYVNGHPAVMIPVRIGEGYRVDQWTQQIREAIAQMSEGRAEGIALRTVFDQSIYTDARLAGLRNNFLLGVAAVFLVVLLMMGWRSAMLVGTAIPLCALLVLIGMQQIGLPIHQMSITGLIIALGLLIDNAIVIVDEVNRRLSRGESPRDAVSATTKHLFLPLLGSTLTTMLAFAPIALLPGPAGEFVGGIATTVIIAVGASFVLSLSITASLAGLMSLRLAGWIARQRERGDEVCGGLLTDGISLRALGEGYVGGLRWLYRRPLVGIAVALVLPVAGFVVATQLDEQFFPPADRDQFQVQVRLPEQASISQTTELMLAARERLLEHPRIEDVDFVVGNSAPAFYYNLVGGADGLAFYAQAMVTMTTFEGGSQTIHEAQQILDRSFPQAQSIAIQLEQGPPFPAPIVMRIQGADIEKLRELGEQARRILSGIPNVTHALTTLRPNRPKLWVALDEEAARLTGLESTQVAQQLGNALDGALGGSLLEGSEELPIRVRLDAQERKRATQLPAIDLYTQQTAAGDHPAGTNIPLGAVADIELRPQIADIERRNGVRMNQVQAYVRAGVLPSTVLTEFERRLDEAGFQLPPGYFINWGGESGERDQAVGSLLGPVAVLGVAMAATMIVALGSFRLAGIIGGVAFASVGLALGAVWLFGYPAGFMAIVGAMGLVGVAINDSIVVLAALKEKAAVRTGDPDAAVEVVTEATRHVLSTTLTTVAGFMPLLLSGGGFWPPLAVAIAGGVVGASLLALTFVPCLYLLMLKFSRRAVPAGIDTEDPSIRPSPHPSLA